MRNCSDGEAGDGRGSWRCSDKTNSELEDGLMQATLDKIENQINQSSRGAGRDETNAQEKKTRNGNQNPMHESNCGAMGWAPR